MKPVLDFLTNVVRFHKLKIAATLGFAAVFFVLLFPYDDLGNLLTTTIYNGSGQQVYVHAQDLELGVLPVPGIQANDVNIEPGARGTPFTPLHFDSLSIRPMLMALLTLRGGASLEASGLFGGVASLSAKTVSTLFSAQQGAFEITDLALQDLSISSILAYAIGANPSFKIGGRVNAASSSLRIDPTSKEPLAGDLGLTLENVVLPTTIPIPNFGEFQDMPQVKIQKADFRTQLANNKLRITQGNLGVADRDPISGRILGEVDIRPGPGGGFVPGQFNICVEINVTQSFYDALAKRLGSAIDLIKSGTEGFRRRDEQGIKYGFTATGPDIRDFQNAEKRPGNCKNFAGTN